jgi:lysine 2,3-aminomutase
MHDMVPGCEHFRTSIAEGEELEKAVRGTTAGFNTPTFVCDLPGGGGKRHIASYEYYDRENGISVWKAPNVKPGEVFFYFDPIRKLSKEAQERWADPKMVDQMLADAKKKAGF